MQDVKHFASHTSHADSYPSMLSARKNLIHGRKDVVLINIDSPSDVRNLVQSPHAYTPGSWVNGVILETQQVSEFIWVRPPAFEAPFKGHRLYPNRAMMDFDVCPKPYADIDRDVIVFDQPLPEPEAGKNVRPLKMASLIAEDLPDLAGRNVMMSLDMDYFSNTGFDTTLKTQVPFEGDTGVLRLFQTLIEKHVRPFVFTTAVSPGYSFPDYPFPQCMFLPNPLKRAVMKIKTDIDGLFAKAGR